VTSHSQTLAGQPTLQHNHARYDAENRITQVNLGSPTGALIATYVYDADGHRVTETTTTGNYSDPAGTFQFLYDQSGRMIQRFDGTFYEGNVYAGGRPLARLAAWTSFIHSDWLGTKRMSNRFATPTTLNNCSSLPFGDGLTCTGSDDSPMHFTGKDRDAATGLDYFGARYNASSMGRFMSPDETFADQHSGDPQSWNLYTYARNNPINDTDEDGRSCVKDANGNFVGDTCDLNTGTGNTPDKVEVKGQWDPSLMGDTKAFFLNLGIGLWNLPDSYFAQITGLRANPEFPEGEGKAAALGAFLGPFLFPEGEITKVEQGAAAMGKLGKTSRGAQSIAKKLGRALREGYKSAFHGSPTTTEEAIRLIRNILSIPARVDNLGKYTEIYNAAGQGVRLEKCTNTFVTFVEGSKARP
jgi:RHS repeat-associated protein